MNLSFYIYTASYVAKKSEMFTQFQAHDCYWYCRWYSCAKYHRTAKRQNAKQHSFSHSFIHRPIRLLNMLTDRNRQTFNDGHWYDCCLKQLI